jgi:hypothetical protein
MDKNLRDYITEAEQYISGPAAGDAFDIEIAPGDIVSTYVLESTEDSITVYGDEQTFALLEEIKRYGAVGSNRGMGFSLEEDDVAEGSNGWIGNPAKWKEAVLQAHGPDVVFKNYTHPGQPGKRSVNAINAQGKQVGVYQRHNKMGIVVQEAVRDQVKKVFKRAGRPVGEVGIDPDGIGSPDATTWYIKHYASGTDLGGYDSYEEAVEELKHLVKQMVPEGSEQVYKVIAVTKSNALSKPKKLNVKADSVDEVFERLAMSDWYPLEINGAEVIDGRRLKKGVSEDRYFQRMMELAGVRETEANTSDPLADKAASLAPVGARGSAPAMNIDENSQSLSQKEWIRMVKAKHPTARITQSKMVNGPVFATLDDGSKLTWRSETNEAVDREEYARMTQRYKDRIDNRFADIRDRLGFTDYVKDQMARNRDWKDAFSAAQVQRIQDYQRAHTARTDADIEDHLERLAIRRRRMEKDDEGYERNLEVMRDRLRRRPFAGQYESLDEGAMKDIAVQISDLVAAGNYNAIYDLLTSSTPAGKMLQDMYNSVAEDYGLHPDDDQEEILDRLFDRIEDDFGGLDEAKYQGREVKLNKPMAGDVKKSKVYVKDPSTGNVKKVNFGDPDMKIKKSNPARRRSFRARHNCDNPGPKTKARFWSCKAW